MKFDKLIDTLKQSVSRLKNKEISEAVESLLRNDSLYYFVKNNQIKCSEFDVATKAMDFVIKMIDKKVNGSILVNIYNKHSIMFIIKMLDSDIKNNKLNQIYLDVATNTDKFDLYVKVNVNRKKLDNDTIFELFWLLPLFSNVKVLMSIDYNKFINEMKDINRKKPDFAAGYEWFIGNNIETMDKNSYKQYLIDGLS